MQALSLLCMPKNEKSTKNSSKHQLVDGIPEKLTEFIAGLTDYAHFAETQRRVQPFGRLVAICDE